MPNVSGSVLFSPNRTITSTSTLDFSNAKAISAPSSKDPSVDAITSSLPKGANSIDSMTPNTINLTMNSTNITNQHFVDAPFASTPIDVLNKISVGPNLITLADNGSFGSNPPGSYVNTSPKTNPYPNLAKDFGYQPYSRSTPQDGYISLVNIQTLSTFGNWWNITDHTTGDESGNFLVVNGDNPGESIFSQKMSVKPSTYYAFSSWIINQDSDPNYAKSKFSINITGISGTISDTFFQNRQVIYLF